MSVLLETSLGDIVFDLYTSLCPNACKNFIKLCKLKFYNNALFINIQKDYLTSIKTLDPQTSLNEIVYGSQARYFDDEIQPSLKHNKMGLIATSNKGSNLNDSDFFITLTNRNLDRLNGKHTIFGELAEGMDILQRLNEQIVDEQNRPYYNIRILHTVVLDDPFEDPKGLNYPENSPVRQDLQTDNRLEFNENIQLLDEQGRTEQEIIEATRDHEARAKAVVLEMLQDLPDADIKPPDNVLFICKLNPATVDEDLELIFSRFGQIRSCEIVKDWKTGASLQYGFIEFETTKACEEAYFKMENAIIDDRRIHVDFSQSVQKMWGKFKRGQKMQKDQLKQAKNENGIQVQIKNQYRRDNQNYQMIFDESNKQEERHGDRRKTYHSRESPRRSQPRDKQRNYQYRDNDREYKQHRNEKDNNREYKNDREEKRVKKYKRDDGYQNEKRREKKGDEKSHKIDFKKQQKFKKDKSQSDSSRSSSSSSASEYRSNKQQQQKQHNKKKYKKQSSSSSSLSRSRSKSSDKNKNKKYKTH